LYQNYNKTEVSPFDYLYIEDANLAHIADKDNNSALTSGMVDRLTQMVMPKRLYLENRTIENGEKVTYEASELIVAGYSVDEDVQRNGDFVVQQGGKLSLYSKEINLKPGFRADRGSEVIIKAGRLDDCSKQYGNISTDGRYRSARISSSDMDIDMEMEEEEVELIQNSPEKQEIQNYPVKFYPNPVSNILNISSGNVDNQLRVYDPNGRWMQTALFSYFLEVDMSGLEAGVYIFQVVQPNGEVTTEQIIKR
jgi:hypothetical protein